MSIESVLCIAGSAGKGAPVSERDWTTEPLGELIEHICATHHAYTRGAIARIPQLLNKVCSVHGARHAELFRIQETFDAMAQELATHLMKEEMMLFPYIARMEEAVIAHEPVLPPPFGTVRNPVRMMMAEHDSAGDGLREIRALSNGYTALGRCPASAFKRSIARWPNSRPICTSTFTSRTIFSFPRALAMEG